jgi:hypothetical protein
MGNMVAAEFESQGSATSGGGMAEGEYRYGALGDAAGENGTGTKGNFAVDGGTPGSGSAALQDPTSSGNGGTGGEQSVASGGTGNSNPAGASGNQESVEGSSSMSAPSFASTEISQSDQTQAPPPGQKWESGASDSGDAADADLLSATVRSEGVMNQPPPKVVEPQGPGAVPIRRTIHLVVRGDHVALLPSRRARGGLEANGATVSLRQSPADVRQQLVDALRERIEEWGLAGNGLYWKPEVELTAGPEATTAASRVVELLGNTGVELSLPRSAQGGTDRATR